MQNWRKPEIQTISIDDLKKMINARARSITSCDACSGCSCAASCEPQLFFWSCTANFFFLKPKIDDDE